MNVKGKTAIISGAASGLGKAVAELLVEQGANVALFDLNETAGHQVAEELGVKQARFFKVDVTDADSVTTGISGVVDYFSALHMCINCAGIAPAKKILNRDKQAMPLANFSQVIQINLVGSFNLARLAAEQMASNEPIGEAGERGIIINTASVAAYDGQMGQCAYAASKSGIVGLTLPMARDLAPLGIRVNAIAPGIMGTPMLLAMPENVQEALVDNIQFPKRMGLPKEFAQLVHHIAENAYLNGETIRLDGGIRMPAR
jgi:NAD(P)-dependent dehydrogenase (short-subunit alcohol dehydrogenase family)